MFKFFELLFGKATKKRKASFEAVVYDKRVMCITCVPMGAKHFHPIYADSVWDTIQECCKCGDIIDYMIIKNRADDDPNDPEQNHEPCNECSGMFHGYQYICPHCDHDHGHEDEDDVA